MHSNELSHIWQRLTPVQRRYVIAMQNAPSKKAAAEAVGVAAQTVYQWPDEVHEAVELVSQDVIHASLEMLKGSLHEATLGKILEMESIDERIAAAARSEIMDRLHGKPTARQEVSMQADLNVESSTLEDAFAALTKRSMQFDAEDETPADTECSCEDGGQKCTCK